jgi:hypothetical protein
MRAPLIFSSVAALVVAGAVSAGFFVLGTPGDVRMRRLDQQRVEDIMEIKSEILNYYISNKVLPESLAKMQEPDSSDSNINFKDRVSGKPYEYKVKDNVSYDLCAEFGAEAGDDDMKAVERETSPFWNHERGRHCYKFHLDPN